VPAAVRAALTGSAPMQRIRPGMRVAIGAGSRGVANLPVIVRTVVEEVRAAGAQPFVFPAMGSHGGATADGQVEMLASLGVTPASVGAEILATMAVMEIGQLPDGPPLYQDANAAAADATLLVNRIKPHTDFHGALESGLAKMAVIGMGKDTGAQRIHVYGGRGFMRFLAPAARIYATNSNLAGGVALLEDAYGETAAVQALDVTEIGAAAETALLEQARALMPRLPFPAIDILVIKEIGKNFSGTGMDTNVVGRILIPRTPETHQPDVAVIAVLDVGAESHGNAAGIGLGQRHHVTRSQPHRLGADLHQQRHVGHLWDAARGHSDYDGRRPPGAGGCDPLLWRTGAGRPLGLHQQHEQATPVLGQPVPARSHRRSARPAHRARGAVVVRRSGTDGESVVAGRRLTGRRVSR